MKRNQIAPALLVVLVALALAMSLSSGRVRPQVVHTESAGPSIPLAYIPSLELGYKNPDTQVYYSQRLGVGFTYAPTTEVPTEHGSVIDFGGKKLTVYTIAPTADIRQAVHEHFLRGISEADCFVEVTTVDPNDGAYQSASIKFPDTAADVDKPWWESDAALKCPAQYRETNGLRFFLMNKNVPDKILFLDLGQDSITSDGQPASEEGDTFDWSHSVKIFK